MEKWKSYWTWTFYACSEKATVFLFKRNENMISSNDEQGVWMILSASGTFLSPREPDSYCPESSGWRQRIMTEQESVWMIIVSAEIGMPLLVGVVEIVWLSKSSISQCFWALSYYQLTVPCWIFAQNPRFTEDFCMNFLN